MSAFDMTYQVTLSDQHRDPVQVTVDQRDWAAHEATDLKGPVTQARYLCWSAMRRAGTYNGSWDRFNTVDAVHVQQLDTTSGDTTGDDQGIAGDQDSDSEGEQSSNPGQSTPSGDSTSSSSAKPASRSRKS